MKVTVYCTHCGERTADVDGEIELSESPASACSDVEEIVIRPGEFLFQFTSLAQWKNKASGWFARSAAYGADCICVDAQGRLCRTGREFMRADEEQTYPIRVFRQARE